MSACVSIVGFHRNRLLTLVVVGVVGLIVSVGFIYLSAPDLALTQISVEVVSVILLLLALNFLPKETPRARSPLLRLRDGALAGVSGIVSACLLYLLLPRALPSLSHRSVGRGWG